MARCVIRILIIGVLTVAAPVLAQEVPPGYCDIHPTDPVCEGGGPGGGGGGGSEVPTPMWWGAAEPVGSACADGSPRPAYLQRLVWTAGPLEGAYVHQSQFTPTPGPGDQVPGGPPGAVFAADGYVYRIVCAAASITDDVWVEARRRMAPIELQRDPVVRGLTGLDTWVWYSGQTQVAPFRLPWVDPSTGVSWVLEARAWIGRLVWAFGDGAAADIRAPVFEGAVAAAGSESEPAAGHVYEVSSGEFGFGEGFPFVFSATWQGEYRWSADGGGTWSPFVPMANSFTDVAAVDYEVIQVRSVITATG